MGDGFELKGIPELAAKLRDLSRKYPEASAAALYQEGFRIWNAAVKMAPVEFGVLRSSAYVSPPTKNGDDASVEVGFGTSYAQAQHERTDYEHPRGGRAGFLREAVNESRSGFQSRMVQQIQRNVEAGVKAVAIAAPTRPGTGAVRVRRKSAARVARASKRAKGRR